MKTAVILLAMCWPPLPDFPTFPEQPVPAPVADSIVPKPADTGPGGLEKQEAEPPTTKRVIAGYRKQCINGVCTMVPIYREVPIEPVPPPTEAEIEYWERTGKAPPKPPPHTHPEETGMKVCDVCGRTCWMLRSAKIAAARNGTTTREEFDKRYGPHAAGTHSQRYQATRRVGPIRRLLGVR